MQLTKCSECDEIIEAICALNWASLTQDDLLSVATGYYYFSVQFCESLRAARNLHPDDENLRELERAECHTDNLSPWPGVAQTGEKINHDEFMRRLLTLSPTENDRRIRLDQIGEAYLRNTRNMHYEARAASIPSYEDGGLERVFRAILTSCHWADPALQAFRHFLLEHIRFDSDAENGHGALSRHLAADDALADRQVAPMWLAFKRLLIESAPSLAT